MIVLGAILIAVGFLLKISLLWAAGLILAIIGVVLSVSGALGRAVGGRRCYY